jgi:hypothetical protein
MSDINRRIREYYRGERISNAIVFFIGLTGITWTLLLYLWRQGQLSTGLFFSALPLCLFFMITGGYRFMRTFRRYAAVQDETKGLDFIKTDEIPHLEDRVSRFPNKRRVNGIGIVLGFSLVFLSVLADWNHLILGTSISLCIFSSLLLIFDLFGQFRTEEILHHLKKLL